MWRRHAGEVRQYLGWHADPDFFRWNLRHPPRYFSCHLRRLPS
jgi:hypothetical protein